MEETCQLGKKYRDYLTGFEGVATGLKFLLHCTPEVLLMPDHLSSDGKLYDPMWFDMPRVLRKSVPIVKMGFTHDPAAPVHPDPDSRWTSQDPRPATP